MKPNFKYLAPTGMHIIILVGKRLGMSSSNNTKDVTITKETKNR